MTTYKLLGGNYINLKNITQTRFTDDEFGVLHYYVEFNCAFYGGNQCAAGQAGLGITKEEYDGINQIMERFTFDNQANRTF